MSNGFCAMEQSNCSFVALGAKSFSTSLEKLFISFTLVKKKPYIVFYECCYT